MRLFGASGERGREKEGRVEGVGEGGVDGCSDTRLAVKVLCLQGGVLHAVVHAVVHGCVASQVVDSVAAATVVAVVDAVDAAVLCVGL